MQRKSIEWDIRTKRKSENQFLVALVANVFVIIVSLALLSLLHMHITLYI